MKKTCRQMAPLFILFLVTLITKAQKPSPELLNPGNHSLVMINHESRMAFAVKSISIEELRFNVAIVAGASRILNIL